MLTEIKTKFLHYFVDENNLRQGEYKTFHENGVLWIHAFYLNNKLHGEYKLTSITGQLLEHTFYQNGKLHGGRRIFCRNGDKRRATFYYQGIDLHVDPDTLTEKDKVYIIMSGRLPHRD